MKKGDSFFGPQCMTSENSLTIGHW